jgi:hypothetical protein
MDTYKLRIKIGNHEFEAEGPVEVVKEQFESWKGLLGLSPAKGTDSPAAALSGNSVTRITEIHTPEGITTPLDVFDHDDKRKLVTLRVHPTSEDRDADAALLVLYGYKEIEAKDEVPVTKLKDALEVSGLRPDRVDRTLAPHMREGLILKAGRGKGGKYRLTNTGYARAQQMVYELFEKMAH